MAIQFSNAKFVLQGVTKSTEISDLCIHRLELDFLGLLPFILANYSVAIDNVFSSVWRLHFSFSKYNRLNSAIAPALLKVVFMCIFQSRESPVLIGS